MPCARLKSLLKSAEKDECFANMTSAKERGKKFAFENINRLSVCRLRIDGCYIDAPNVKKCDYLFAIKEKDKYYLIELKGSDISRAMEQIVSTYQIVNKEIKESPRNYKGVIVSSVVPLATQQRFRVLQEKYIREQKLNIVKTHIQHTEII